MPNSKELILFDLDGVILDSRANMERAWKQVRIQLGVTTDFEAYFALIGRPFADILDQLGLSERTEEIERVYRLASINHMDLATIYRDVEASLEAMSVSGLKLGIVTSKDPLRTGIVLALLPVHFATVQAPDKRYRGKPAPDQLLVAMAETHTDPVRVVYVGDMVADFEAAQRAGIDYIHADWGYGKAPDGSCIGLKQFCDLLSFLGLMMK